MSTGSVWLKCISYLWRSIPILRSGQQPAFLYSMHGSSFIVLNCYRKESTMTRFNTWSQTSAAYTKPNPAKMEHSLTPAISVSHFFDWYQSPVPTESVNPPAANVNPTGALPAGRDQEMLLVGSEEAREIALVLASVRLSNCTCSVPACSSCKDSTRSRCQRRN